MCAYGVGVLLWWRHRDARRYSEDPPCSCLTRRTSFLFFLPMVYFPLKPDRDGSVERTLSMYIFLSSSKQTERDKTHMLKNRFRDLTHYRVLQLFRGRTRLFLLHATVGPWIVVVISNSEIRYDDVCSVYRYAKARYIDVSKNIVLKHGNNKCTSSYYAHRDVL